MPRSPITTDKQIAALKANSKEFEVAIDGCPGLRVRVAKKPEKGTAKKTFYYRYRKPKEVSKDKVRGDLQKMALGTYPRPLSLADARDEWERLRAIKKNHGIPQEYEKQRLAENVKALTNVAEIEAKDRYTVETLIREFATFQARKIRTWEEQERCLKVYVSPHLGTMAAHAVRRGEVSELLDKLKSDDKKVQANRVLAHLRSAYNWAIEREKGGIEFNPCSGIKKAKETARERFLGDAELRKLLANLPGSTLTTIEQDLLCFILLTGVRLSEACEAPIGEFDTRKKLWTLPASRAKNGREHLIPLSTQTVDLVRRRKTKSAYLFPAVSDSKRSMNPSRIHSPLKAAIPQLKVLPFTPHDLRRSCASGLAALGASRHIISRILNHSDNSVTAIYDRHTYEPEMREWLQKWADHLENLTAATNVKRLKEVR